MLPGSGRRPAGVRHGCRVLRQSPTTARPAQAALARPDALLFSGRFALWLLDGGRLELSAVFAGSSAAPPAPPPAPSKPVPAPPQGQDQSVLLGLGERAGIGERDHPGVKPSPPAAVKNRDFLPKPETICQGDEQLQCVRGIIRNGFVSRTPTKQKSASGP